MADSTETTRSAEAEAAAAARRARQNADVPAVGDSSAQADGPAEENTAIPAGPADGGSAAERAAVGDSAAEPAAGDGSAVGGPTAGGSAPGDSSTQAGGPAQENTAASTERAAGDGSAAGLPAPGDSSTQADGPAQENTAIPAGPADGGSAGGPAAVPAAVSGAAAPAKLGAGPGRLLLSLYGVFTVAALSRSIVQISTKYHEAPLAYVLSAVAGVMYAVITLALWKGGESARRVALVCCSAELAGVLAVGTLTLVDSSAFPDATVWSDFGIGYVFLPLALPVTGLLWLRRAAREQAGTRPEPAGTQP